MAGASDDGDVGFGPITLHLPDASEPTFWLMHDLAGLFGLEVNSEAEAKLRTALRAAKVRGVDLDHESDYVFVHCRSVATMMATLRVLIELAPAGTFAAVDLDATEAALRAWKRPKPLRYDIGDVFAVPLDDDRFGAVQVLCFPDASETFRGTPIVVALDLAASGVEELRAAIEQGRGAPMAVRSIIDPDIVSGRWPKLAARTLPALDVARIVLWERSRSGPVQTILAACLGVIPWEEYDPHPHEPHLLAGVTPPRKRNRRTVFEHRVKEVFGEASPRAETGPATLHIVIAYRGGTKEVPNLELPKLRTMLREMTTQQPATTSDDERCVGGGFDGFLDVFVQVADVATALHHLDGVADSLKIAKDLYAEAYPPFAFDWRGALRRMR